MEENDLYKKLNDLQAKAENNPHDKCHRPPSAS